eukprot:171556_1
MTKTILENLVEVWELNNVLQEYLSVGCEDKIVYLLKQLMLQKDTITKRNVFWKQFGNIINDTDQFLLIVKNLLMVKQDDNRINTNMLMKVVEEMGVVNDNDIKSEYLCHRLYSKTDDTITNKNAFWTEIGFIVDEHDYDLITIISNHPLLVKHSQYETIEHTILHRFVEELEMNNILQEYLSIDSAAKIDYLLKKLMLQKTRI